MKRKQTSKENEKSSGSLKSSEYDFSVTKIKKWQKKFTFWNTPNQQGCDNKNLKATWIEVSVLDKIYTCWVCKEYPTVANKSNEVAIGTGYCHRNYVTWHCSNSAHFECIYKYVMEQYPDTQGDLETTVAKMVDRLTTE